VCHASPTYAEVSRLSAVSRARAPTRPRAVTVACTRVAYIISVVRSPGARSTTSSAFAAGATDLRPHQARDDHLVEAAGTRGRGGPGGDAGAAASRPCRHHRAVSREAQTRTGMSINKIVKTLRPLRTATITLGGHQLQVAPRVPANAQRLLDDFKSGHLNRYNSGQALVAGGDQNARRRRGHPSR
jgi:hypothetical protein